MEVADRLTEVAHNKHLGGHNQRPARQNLNHKGDQGSQGQALKTAGHPLPDLKAGLHRLRALHKSHRNRDPVEDLLEDLQLERKLGAAPILGTPQRLARAAAVKEVEQAAKAAAVREAGQALRMAVVNKKALNLLEANKGKRHNQGTSKIKAHSNRAQAAEPKYPKLSEISIWRP